MGAKSRRKGYRLEWELANELRKLGLDVERVPLSGAGGGTFSGDLLVNGKRAEVKG
ncbi:hypothetical protein H5T89_12015, partial [bacterium]|nr:hypothetical protein [bacterium]